MLILCLLSLQFAVTYGDFMCMYIETLRCYMPIAKIKDYDFCTSHDEVMECLKKEAVRCQVANAKEVMDMQKLLTDVCQDGSELNKEYLQHKTCYSQAMAAAAKAPCLADFRNATVREVQSLRGLYLEEFKTSDDAKAELVAEVSCRYTNAIIQCSKETMNKTCGEDSMNFFQKVKSPKEHFMQLACNESEDYGFSAAAAVFSWTVLLLQVFAALIVFKASSL